jgi:hypothetical protein
MDVAARDEELVADLAGRHAREAEDEVAGRLVRSELADVIDGAVAPLWRHHLEGNLVAVKTGQVAKALRVTAGDRRHMARC